MTKVYNKTERKAKTVNENEIWKIVLDNMKVNNGFTDLTINLWFSRVVMKKLTANKDDKPGKAYFSTDNDLIKNIIDAKYSDLMRKELNAALGFDVEPIIISCEKSTFEEQLAAIENEEVSDRIKMVEKMLDEGTEKSSDDMTVAVNTARNTSKPHIFVSPSLPEYSPEYTFDNFVVGSSNNHAYHMAKSVAANPAKIANPLFIHGSPGLGKTHLLYAITREISDLYPDFKIIYTKGEDFTNELIGSLASKTPILFREKYRNADVLLMDDIQFIAGKESIQEEFFHTYEALFEAGKQIIVTSDRLPKDIKTLAERLRSRFEHGIIIDVQPPDLELRVAIFKKKSQALGMNVPNDVLMYLGENVKDNIRQIEGALKKMRAMAFIEGCDVCMEHAKVAVNDILTAKAAAITPEKIITHVSQKTNIPFEDIVGKRKTDAVANARQIAVFLIRELTDMSHANVGKVFNRDHSTVVASVNKIKERMKQDPVFEAQIDDMMADLKASAGY